MHDVFTLPEQALISTEKKYELALKHERSLFSF